MSLFTKRVNTNDDNGYKWPPPWPAWYNDDPQIGKTNAGNPVNCAVRFTVVNIPQGATIDSAKLTFQKWRTETFTLVSKISGMDEDNTATLTSDPMGRPETSAKVDWDRSGSWVEDTEYDTSDITSIVQEIVDRPGWSEGQAMGFFIKDDGCPANDDEICFYSYSRDSARCTFLTVNFTGWATITKTVTAKAVIGRHIVTCKAKANIYNPLYTFGWKVSKPGQDVFGDDPKNLIFSSNLSLLKITAQGTTDIEFADGGETATVEVNHSLGYAPAFLVFMNSNQSDKVITDGYRGFSDVDYCRLDAYVTDTKLWLRGRRETTAGVETKVATYFILADPA